MTLEMWYNTGVNHIKSGQMLEASTRPFSSRVRGTNTMSDHTLPLFPLQEEIEEWRDVPGYEGYYQVSSFGRVRSLDRVIAYTTKDEDRGRRGYYAARTFKGKEMVASPSNSDKYLRLTLKKSGAYKMFTLHSLVALAFLGPRPDGHDVHHIDGDKSNNRSANLEYLPSRKHSSMHSAKEKPWVAKLNRSQADDIKRRLTEGTATPTQLAKEYGVSRGAIRSIRVGGSWK